MRKITRKEGIKMRIESNYAAMINRLLQGQDAASQTENQREAQEGRQSAEGAERQETSRLMDTVQQELERLEQSEDPDRAQRLQSIQEQIQAGEYRVDSRSLAEAMLEQTEETEEQ